MMLGKLARAEVWSEWTGEKWIVRAPTALTGGQLQRIANFQKGVQAQRRLGLPPGDLRDDLDRSIKALDEGRIESAIAGGGDVFKSTHRTNDDRFLDLGA